MDSRRSAARARERRRFLAAFSVLLIGLGLIAFDLFRGAGDPTPGNASVVDTPLPVVSPAGPSPSAAPEGDAGLQMPGDFPATGPGTFVYATSIGPLLGQAGTLKRYRVAAETNVATEELAEFTRMVDETLGDQRSWIGSKQLRMQRVPAGSPYEFTVLLATGETTRKLCASGGMDVRENGVPFTSCQLSGKVVINLNRWRQSVPDYVDAAVPLHEYRQYVINHETGHALGHGHETCPTLGGPAPVMQQQTLGLHGCAANAWPYLDGKRFAGPSGVY